MVYLHDEFARVEEDYRGDWKSDHTMNKKMDPKIKINNPISYK